MSRVAIYTRVSTARQNTEAQIRNLEEWAERAGHEIVVVYSETVSGAKKRRPQFDAMMTAAKNREFDLLAVWDLDRLGRTIVQIINTVNDLSELGIEFWIAKSSTDTSTSSGKIMLAVYAAMAELERDLNRERTRAGIETARQRGKKLGRPKAGSRRDPNKAQNVRLDENIRSMLKDGQGINRIAKQLGVGDRRVARVRDESRLPVDAKERFEQSRAGRY